MKIIEKNISELKPYERNAKLHPPKQIGLLKKNIEKFGAKIERTCKNCGKLFSVYKSALRSSNASGNYCKRECYNQFLKTRKGKLNNNYSRIERNCDYCKKDILVIPSKIKEYRNHFCSRICKSIFHIGEYSGDKNANWRGGHINRKGDFYSIKTRYFKKKQFCALCGTFKKIHIHHIIPFRNTQDNSLKNLIPLCVKHHRSVEIITNKLIDKRLSIKNIGLFMKNILRDRQQHTSYFIQQCLLQI